jgi:hypothetical protein
MKTETKRVFRLFFVWQDEAEEKWLERQERDGWRLARPGPLYLFERSTPAEARYRLDYRSRMPGGQQEYLDLFRDAGWHWVGRFGGWQYFRSSSPEAPEVFSDVTSRMQKYKQMLALLLAALLVNLITFTPHIRTLDWVRGVQIVVLVTLSYGMLRILLRLRRLRTKGS